MFNSKAKKYFKKAFLFVILFFINQTIVFAINEEKRNNNIEKGNYNVKQKVIYMRDGKEFDYEIDKQNQIKYIKKLINDIKKKIYIIISEKPEKLTEQEENMLSAFEDGLDYDFLNEYKKPLTFMKKYSDFRKKLIEKKIDFLDFDLNKMKLTFYVKGKKDSQDIISGKGRPGSWWETPPGLYFAQDKRPMVELTLSDRNNPIFMPKAVRFSGLFFVHRWPEFKNGKPLPGFYTEGCVRLNKRVSEKVYNFVSPGTPILMYDENEKIDDDFYGLDYEKKYHDNGVISADKYFIADIDNNKVLLTKKEKKKVYLNDITKLIFMLTATEWIEVKEQKEAIWLNTSNQYFPETKLKEGVKYSLLDLGALMLSEKSKAANEEIADRIWQVETSLMKRKSESIGMNNFKYTNYIGDKKENISSMSDIFYLLRNLYKNRKFILDMTLNKAYNKKYRKNIFENKLDIKNIWKDEKGFKGGITGVDNNGKKYGAGIFKVNIKGENRNLAFIIYESEDLKKDFKILKGFIKFYYDK